MKFVSRPCGYISLCWFRLLSLCVGSRPGTGTLNGLEARRIAVLESVQPQTRLDIQPYAKALKAVRVGQ
jgi:hypothetical protein